MNTITQHDIQTAYNDMINTLICLEDATLEAERAKVAWQVAFEDALANGELDGRNEATRNAQARAQFPTLWAELQTAEQDHAIARKEYKVSELTCKMLSKQLQLMELMKGKADEI